ncbi:hypothetical protein C0W59_21735 [Photobacterium kishitanii]|uniref:acyltransferase family protein n=1 Tax=Photobacterium kishitanii TaxID=318456 RepID=UPI000D16BB0F|nr:acyltransferase [Photobacterium kishitanii]PSV09964.1 hypothetical protein C0W59_21735 [Photobacterium kishitanii]
MQENSRRYGSIDGLRAILAISVFIHHYVITYVWKTKGIWVRPESDFYNHLGQASVGFFFIITGYLFTKKMIMTKNNWLDFFIGRVFRIYPIYLFVTFIVILYSFYMISFNLNVPIKNLLLELFDWGVFVTPSINGNNHASLMLAGVTWTLSYEWFFYIMLPLLYVIYNKIKPLFVILVFAIFYFSINPIVIEIWVWTFNSIMFSFFAFGFICALIESKTQKTNINVNNKYVFCMALFLFFLLFFFFKTSFGFYQSFIIGIIFLLFTYGFDFNGLLKNKIAIYLGDISYSIYLIHGLVLYTIYTILFPSLCSTLSFSQYMLLMPLVLLVVIFVSSITYLYIEKPMIKIGKDISKKFKNNVN